MKKAVPLSRIAQFVMEDAIIDIPEIESGRYLVDLLYDVGPFLNGAGGPAPLTYQEIFPWMETLGLRLNAWEVRTLCRLSYDYVVQARDSRIPTAPAPFIGIGTRRDHVAKKIDSVFG